MYRANISEALRVAIEALEFYRDNWEDRGLYREPNEDLSEDGGDKAVIAVSHIKSLVGKETF